MTLPHTNQAKRSSDAVDGLSELLKKPPPKNRLLGLGSGFKLLLGLGSGLRCYSRNEAVSQFTVHKRQEELLTEDDKKRSQATARTYQQ